MSSLKQRMQEEGIESTMLDNLVHDAASRRASAINNDGMSAQLEYLEQCGVSDQEIADELGIDLNGDSEA